MPQGADHARQRGAVEPVQGRAQHRPRRLVAPLLQGITRVLAQPWIAQQGAQLRQRLGGTRDRQLLQGARAGRLVPAAADHREPFRGPGRGRGLRR
ncbi:MAG: hypothetical protein FJ397_15555, partial [Verrucomicrobia bacterium]|nr:hypothetical protein [Verrucomicrobiota bacterium]